MLLCLENQASCAAVWGGPVTTSLHRPKHGLATEQPLRLPGISGGREGEGRRGMRLSHPCGATLGTSRHLSTPSGV